MMWTLLACGRLADGAGPRLAAAVAEFLSDPQYGTDLTQLVIGSGSPVSGLHVPAGERVPEPAVA